MLQYAEAINLIHGLQFGRSSLSISHLSFADDSLIFSRADAAECAHLKSILDKYSAASRQVINYDKSSILISPNASPANVRLLQSTFNLSIVSCHDIYLGLPSMIGRKKSQPFSMLKERIRNKILGWTSKLFSCGGKEILIKVVAQAIPTYSMSVFRLPIGFCSDLQQMVADYWWSHSSSSKGVHWLQWRLLCQPKSEGGMGFRDLIAFNQALLAKQC